MVFGWVLWWIAGAALWLALVDRVAVSELVIGAVAATVAATAATIVRGGPRRPQGPPPGSLRAAWRVVADVPALVRALRSPEAAEVVELPYDPDASTALAEALGSAGPNTIVLDVDPERRVMRAHRLVPPS
jgi:multisubunit Na+/H+ antiporter MnhE subunit